MVELTSSVSQAASNVDSDASQAAFLSALTTRRQQVYDYLDNWPGAAQFQPADIHDAIYSYIKRRGKALRPSVLLLCCGAVGGDEMQALPAAAAVEVFHTWTLVHDDIIDRDDTRRGRPTVHAMYAASAKMNMALDDAAASHYGTAVAILAGDSQHSWAYGLLFDLINRGVDAKLVVELAQRMATNLTPLLLDGEMLDVQYSLTPVNELTEANVLDMLAKKTGTLLEYSAWCGAKIGMAGKPDPKGFADKLGRFAYLCGTAFQLHDDVLGLTADEAKLGKPVGSDIREGKRTLIIYRALAGASATGRQKIMAALGNSDATDAEIASALDIIRHTGACDDVSNLANSQISQAMAILQDLPETPERVLLASWAAFLLSRQY